MEFGIMSSESPDGVLGVQFNPNSDMTVYLLTLTNKSGDYVAFKVKQTKPTMDSVNPEIGVLSPHSTCHARGMKQDQANMKWKYKFEVLTVVSPDYSAVKQLASNVVEWTKVKDPRYFEVSYSGSGTPYMAPGLMSGSSSPFYPPSTHTMSSSYNSLGSYPTSSGLGLGSYPTSSGLGSSGLGLGSYPTSSGLGLGSYPTSSGLGLGSYPMSSGPAQPQWAAAATQPNVASSSKGPTSSSYLGAVAKVDQKWSPATQYARPVTPTATGQGRLTTRSVAGFSIGSGSSSVKIERLVAEIGRNENVSGTQINGPTQINLTSISLSGKDNHLNYYDYK